MKPTFAIQLSLLAVVAGSATALAQTDAQTVEEMERRSSLVCSGYSVERGNPGIHGVKVDALRVLLERRYTLCPDRRVEGDAAVLWYPQWGSLVWNPTNPSSVRALAAKADQLTRTLDFPRQLTVWNSKGAELTGQTVPEFQSRCAEEVFSKCF